MPCSAWTKTPLFSLYPLCFVHDDSQTEKILLYNPLSRLSERITINKATQPKAVKYQ